MPSVEDVLKKTQEVAEQNKKLTEENQRYKSLMTTRDLSGVHHFDESGRVVGSISDAGESVSLMSPGPGAMGALKQMRTRRHESMKTLRSAGYVPRGEFKSFNDFVQAGMEFGGTNIDGGNTTRSSKFDNRMDAHFKALKAVQGMSEQVGADGGFTVIPEFAPGILDYVYANMLWDMTDNYTVSGNNMTFKANAETSRADGSRHGGMLGYWIDEGLSLTKSKPTFRDITVKLNKLAVLVYLTNELIADAGDALENYVTRKASEEFNFLLGNALWNGTGAGQPLGVLNAPSFLAITKETGQAGKSIVTENIEKMYNRYYAANLPAAKWFHNQDCQSQLGLMTLGIGAAGIATYMPDVAGGMAHAPFGTLKGLPRQPLEFAQTVGTQGDIVLADMKQMITISKGGVMQAVSMHVEFLTDQLALRFVMRVGGQPWEISPITPYNGTNTQSSFVGLATRA